MASIIFADLFGLLLDEGFERAKLIFEKETGKAAIIGPENAFLKSPRPATVDFFLHRDIRANAAMVEVQGHKILLEPGQWSRWTKVAFELSTPAFVPGKSVSGICRFYLQEVSPNFRLYVTPVNIDPSDPAVALSEPAGFVQDVSKKIGLHYTTGFQEDHKARTRVRELAGLQDNRWVV